MNLKSLIAAYHTDADSSYRALRFCTRERYNSLTGRIERDYGLIALADVKARTILTWHREWSATGHVAMAHSLIGMLRTLVGFGATILENTECARLSAALHTMRFKMAKPREQSLTLAQVEAIRGTAHVMGMPSIALAQAIQFDCMLRQRDCLGEWIPESEPGASTVFWRGMKWNRGVTWEEIDQDLILTHVTSKRQKTVVIDLKLAPMVIAEVGGKRGTGPVIINERTGHPYLSHQFRYAWRQVARRAGVPDSTFNMDSRSGAISEATAAGVPLEHIRHLSTHGDVSMVQRYSRQGAEKAAEVMKARIEHRTTGGQ